MANLSDLTAQAADAPIGTGLARMAGNTIQLKKAYDKYSIATQENGEEPIPFKEWVMQNNS